MKTGLGKSALLLSFAIVGCFGMQDSRRSARPSGPAAETCSRGRSTSRRRTGSSIGRGPCRGRQRLSGPAAAAADRRSRSCDSRPCLANQRPPDNVDGGLVRRPRLQVGRARSKEFLVYAPPLPLKVGRAHDLGRLRRQQGPRHVRHADDDRPDARPHVLGVLPHGAGHAPHVPGARAAGSASSSRPRRTSTACAARTRRSEPRAAASARPYPINEGLVRRATLPR